MIIINISSVTAIIYYKIMLKISKQLKFLTSIDVIVFFFFHKYSVIILMMIKVIILPLNRGD